MDRPPAEGAATGIKSPFKAHLRDGSTVVFRNGGTVSHDRITGTGVSYALLSSVGTPRTSVPMDSVVGVEAFDAKLLAGTTIITSAAATVVGVFGAALLSVALFGSCPTVYAATAAGLELEAEGFSYAIAPIMEHRDVDALRLRAGPDGVLRLELRNEALETHYINHVELLAVHHAAGDRVVPDQLGRPITLRAFGTVAGATDRAGRDVRRALATHDGVLFSSAASTIAHAREGDLDDWIDLDVSALPPGDSVAVFLRLRNSLLNTVLLYEGMLGGRDAVDWLNTGLQNIAGTVELARWYSRTMGMHASVGDAAVHMGDVGPIAFRDVTLVLPRPAPDATRARIRLRFVADNWRIDEVRVAGTITRPDYAPLPVDSIIVQGTADGDGPLNDAPAVAAVAQADEDYLETRPGQRMSVVFRGDARANRITGGQTTYLLAWQGWYREWIRGAWLASPMRTEPFVPGDAAVLTALRRWTDQKEAFERQFYASRIPVL
ncbi:MAG: hypothetical protein ACYC0B_08385 [Gemmatimonadaceae bacterium]